MKKIEFLGILLCLLFTYPLYGQSTKISGKVIDQNGSVIPNVTVVIKNNLATQRETITDSNGDFDFSNLTPGKYNLTFEKSGFESLSQQVSSGQTSLNFVLRVRAVGATVNVSAETYSVENGIAATKLSVPLKYIPQSIQVINQNILRDRASNNFAEAVTQNVSGVTRHTTDLTGSGAGDFLRFRGFAGSYNNSYLRDGLKFANYGANESAEVERIEVLKGTSSVLYGRAEPGGLVNLVTKQPTTENFITGEFAAGQFNFYRPQIDSGGKLFTDNLLYRVNFAYQHDGNFREDSDGDRVFIAPVVLWKPSSKLQVAIESSYLREVRGMDVGQPMVNGIVADIPVERGFGESFGRSFQQNRNGGIRGKYDFNSDWSIQSAYRIQLFDYTLYAAFPAIFSPPVEADGRTVQRDLAWTKYKEHWNYSDTNFSGKFSTGKVKHNILGGVEYGNVDGLYNHIYYLAAILGPFAFPSTDIYNRNAPVTEEYVQQWLQLVSDFKYPSDFGNRVQTFGYYVQDLIEIDPKFKVLVGGRFDVFKQRFFEDLNPTVNATDKKFSPRVGFVYLPVEVLSFYASYGNSFAPQLPNQMRFDNRLFEPSLGEQFEGGVKYNALNGKISASVAFYNLAYKNLVVSDPTNPGFSVQTGKQRSRGVEFDISATPLRGMNLLANFSIINATVAEDTDTNLLGKFLPNTARNNGNIWATYRFVDASNFLKNFGIGAGLQSVGKRYTSLTNTAQIPAYSRVDATTFYDFSATEKTHFRFAANLQNLTNTRYYESSFGFNDTVYPGAPFRALFSFRITRR